MRNREYEVISYHYSILKNSYNLGGEWNGTIQSVSRESAECVARVIDYRDITSAD